MCEKNINWCDPERYVQHEYYLHIEKFNKWLVENHRGRAKSDEWGLSSEEIDERFNLCNCREKHEEYQYYYDICGFDHYLDEIPDLTEKEKEELEDIFYVYIYICPECGTWSVSGQNV